MKESAMLIHQERLYNLKKRDEELKKNEQDLREMWDITECTHIHILGRESTPLPPPPPPKKC